MQTRLLVVFLIAGACPRAVAAQVATDEWRISPLRGLPGVQVAIDLSDTAAAHVSQMPLLTDTELRLRNAGIRVFTEEEAKNAPHHVALLVWVEARQNSERFYVYTVRVSVREDMKLLRKPFTTEWVIIWDTGGGIGGTGDLENGVTKYLQELIDEFLNAYLAANPRSQ